MRAWTYLLGGLGLWAFHFFALYIAGSVFLTSTTTRWIVLAITLLCFAGAAGLTAFAWRRRAESADPFGKWTHQLAAMGAAVALVAIFWQGLPALLI